MSKIEVITGRGGTGKSTFTALRARYGQRKKLLLIDLDPDGSLPKMLGVDLEKEGVLTISDALAKVMEKGKRGQGEEAPPDLLTQMLATGEIISRNNKFDLITLGTKLASGCYCLPDELIKETIKNIQKDYDLILVDSPAGLEHLNRKVTPDIDVLFVILDPSEKSVKHIERIKYVVKGVNIHYQQFYLIGNYRFTEETEGFLLRSGEKYLGRIANDPLVREFNLKGESLWKIPDDSPAALSVKKILQEAGYVV